MISVKRMQIENVPTIKVIHYVLDELAGKGEEGADGPKGTAWPNTPSPKR